MPVTLTWTTGAGATKYDVTFNGSTTVDVTGTSFGPVVVISGTNTCSVVAKNDCGQVAASLDWSFSGLASCGEFTIVGRYVFYNNSFFDTNAASCRTLMGGVPACNDDTAIAPDKTALLPGQTASFANYISYDKSINGIMVDFARSSCCPAIAVTAADFVFQMGNIANPTTLAPTPTVTVVAGGGVGGADRVKMIWADGAIPNTNWLKVRVLANANTNLAADDVFYFGIAKGEDNTPGSVTRYLVNATDEVDARNNPRNALNRAPITFVWDYSRDSLVNATDQLISRNNGTNSLNALLKITATP